VSNAADTVYTQTFPTSAVQISLAAMHLPVGTYTWRVVTVADGNRIPSDEWTIAYDGVPLAPTGQLATAIDAHDVVVAWVDNSYNETGFQITDGSTVQTVLANINTYMWGGITPGATKCFQVRSYNASATSAWTPSVCATTPAP